MIKFNNTVKKVIRYFENLSFALLLRCKNFTCKML